MDLNYIKSKFVEISGFDHLTLVGITITISSIISVFCLELIIIGWKNSSIKRLFKFDKSIQNDLYYTLLDIFNIYNIIAFIITLGFFYILSSILQKNIHFNLISYIKNPFLQFVIIYLLIDLKNYTVHFVFHRYYSLWKIHEFHHSATKMNILTSYRNHFFVKGISSIFDVLFLVVIGAPLLTFLSLQILQEIHRLIIHSSIKSNWGIIGKYILVSPLAHQVHHSINPVQANKNFGSTFIFWDKIFRTYYTPCEVIEYGLPNNPYNKKGFIYDCILVVKNTLISIFKSKRKNS